MKVFAWILFVTFFAFGISSAGATSSARHKWLQKELDLTSEQRIKIKAILQQYQEKIDSQMRSVSHARDELRTEFRTHDRGPAHEKHLQKKFMALQKARAEKHELRFQMAMEIRKILSDKQLDKMNSLKAFNRKNH